MPSVIKYVTMQESPLVIRHEHRFELPKTDEDLAREEAIKAEKLKEQLMNEILDVANAKADAIIASAQSTSVQTLNDAVQQAEQLKRQAQEEGHREGYQAGYSEGKQAALDEMQENILQSVEKSQHILKIADKEAKEMILQAERQIVAIAIELARKVLAFEMEENPTVILPVVKAALDKVRDQAQIVIRVNPEDYAMVMEARRDLQLMIGSEHALTVQSDQTILTGGCMIDTDYGTVDARLDRQFETLVKTVQEVLP